MVSSEFAIGSASNQLEAYPEIEPLHGLQRVLYYLEPSIELDDPLFRFSTYRAILLPEAKALLDHDPRIEIAFVLSDAVFQKALAEGHTDERISYCALSSDNVQIDPLAAYKGELPTQTVSAISHAVRSQLGNFDPQVILAYENPGRHLKAIWPDAAVLNVMFGAVSRPPFPSLANFDPLGLQGHSFLARHADTIRNWDASADEREFVRQARKKFFALIGEYQPYKRLITRLRQRARKLILFPCQVDGHFSVVGTAIGHATHFEAIRAIASALPEDAVLLVTQHKYKPALSRENVRTLLADFHNIEIFTNAADVADVSQYVLPYTDGVATFSSSLGFQAALWGLPLLTLSDSYLNCVSDTHDIAEFASLIEDERLDVHRFDPALTFIFLRYSRPYRTDIFKGEAFYGILSDMTDSLRSDPSGEAYFFQRHVDVDEAATRLLTSTTGHIVKKERAGKAIETDHLITAICRNDVISYDLFDTLVDRPFLEPYDAFTALEREIQQLPSLSKLPFTRLRRQAEADVRRPTNGAFEITIDDIYDRLGELGGLDLQTQDDLLTMELAMELQVCGRKRTIEPYLRISKLTSRAIVVASDFYIREEFVADLLKKNNIPFDKLYVSATERSRKHNGTMFKLIIQYAASLGVPRDQILHVGDNKTADVDMAKHNGLNAFWAPSGNVNLRKSLIGTTYLKSAISTRSAASSVLSGMIASRFYNAPFNQVDLTDCFNGDLHQIGYGAYGPLIVGFAQWIRKWTKQQGIRHVLFLARDGKIVMDAYRALYGDLEDQHLHYVLSSRRSLRVAAATDLQGLIDLGRQSFNAQPLDEYLRNRFGFEFEARHSPALRKLRLHRDSVISMDHNFGRVLQLIEVLKDDLLEVSRSEREAYLAYLQSVGLLDPIKTEQVAVVDIGYSASIQKGLETIIPEAKMEGLYILTHEVAERDFDTNRIHGFLGNYDDHLTGYRHALNDHVFLFETGFSSFEGSLLRFTQGNDGTVTPVTLAANNELARVRLLGQIHAGVADFVAEYKRRLGRYADLVSLGPRVAESQIIAFAKQPSRRDAELFIGCEVENVFGGGSTHLIEPTSATDAALTPEVLQHTIKLSSWKPGARVVYGPAPAPAPAKASAVIAKAGQPVASTAKPPAPTSKKVPAPKPSKPHGPRIYADPFTYFDRSKKPWKRSLRHLFHDNPVGRMNVTVARRIVTALGKRS